MNDLFFCANCESLMNLDRHLRCSVCGSDAVDIALRPSPTVEGLCSAYIGEPEKALILAALSCEIESMRKDLERLN